MGARAKKSRISKDNNLDGMLVSFTLVCRKIEK